MSDLQIKLQVDIVEQIKREAKEGLPNEICGYLAGRKLEEQLDITTAYPLTNVDKSPEHFSFDPKEQFEVFNRASKEGKQLLGIYHSHPETPARMSEEDIRLANDPLLLYAIYSVVEDEINLFSVKKNDKQEKVVIKHSKGLVCE